MSQGEREQEDLARKVEDLLNRLDREVKRRMEVETALQESENRLLFLARTSGDALYQLRYDSMTYDYLSQGIEALTGYTPEEINRISFASLVQKIEPQGAGRTSRGLIREKRLAGETGEHKADYLVKTKSGELRWVGDHSFPWKDGTGKAIGSVGILTDVTERRQLINRLRQTQEELKRLSLVDGLTGVANRRHFDEVLEREWRRAKRDRKPLCLVMIDLDLFKRYNDTHGHLAGDDCLKAVSGALRESLRRPGDFVARYGGEEFAVLLPGTGAGAGRLVAESLRTAVQGLEIPHQGGPETGRVTISQGVAATDGGSPATPQELISLADAALYRAKELGRNRVAGSGS